MKASHYSRWWFDPGGQTACVPRTGRPSSTPSGISPRCQNEGGTVHYEGIRTDALALLRVQGRRYEIRDEGPVC